ncbi:CBS domain-containing protein [Geobacter sp. DSM 9736]|uniref:CBS domain-containing protein n=1 Tax=Geobacter sp. DSM 9736 TaxID=1277350 RepID=UPI000B50EE08|nr:CBS domain-containing protein [Geobacter sp. DSM 9736]SNB46051.1 acetoin utilization protein AcuB [Geobacter sp. DSM 9736]
MTTVERWMTRGPVTIEADATIIEAIHLLKEKNVRRLPVMEKGKFVGLLTERMIKEFTPSKATALDTWEMHYILSKTQVRQAMNPNPLTVTPDTDLIEAAQLIHDRKLYGICVTDRRGNLVGILTTTNILEALIAICRNPQICGQ